MVAWVYGDTMPVATTRMLLNYKTAAVIAEYTPSLYLSPRIMSVVQGVVYFCMGLCLP